MYFLRLRRLPFVAGVLIGLLLPLPQPYDSLATVWGWICSTIMLVEHLLILAVSIRYGGWYQGATVAGVAILVSGMTLPEFHQAAKQILRQAEEDWRKEQATAAQQARFAEAAKQAAQVEREQRSRRYTKRLRRLLGGGAAELTQVSDDLAAVHPSEAEARLVRAERLAGYLRDAERLGAEHSLHLQRLFDQRLSAAEEDRQAQAYLVQVRLQRSLLEEAHRLSVLGEVTGLLQRGDDAAVEGVLTRARASAARHLELQQLKSEVDRAPAHIRGHLTELLAAVRTSLGNPREFRKAAYALRQALPKNGHASPRT